MNAGPGKEDTTRKTLDPTLLAMGGSVQHMSGYSNFIQEKKQARDWLSIVVTMVSLLLVAAIPIIFVGALMMRI